MLRLFLKFKTETEQQLVEELEKVQTELEPLEQQRQQLEKGVETRTNVFVWGGLAFMAVQFGFLARLTWWEYSWDIMEPVTYFVTYATSMACYAYFVLTRQVSFSLKPELNGRFWTRFIFFSWCILLSKFNGVDYLTSPSVYNCVHNSLNSIR